MSSQNFLKDVNLTSKAILSGCCYQCFDINSLKIFLGCIQCCHSDKDWLRLQAKSLLILSWFLPGIPLKKLLRCVSADFKINRKQIDVLIPGYEKTVIPLMQFDKVDPFAQELWDYIHLIMCFAPNGRWLCFSQLITRYVDSLGYQDSTRKLRYHFRRWLKNYNNKVESVD